MIRNSRGDHFLLITQHDHALLSGELAERIGTPRFEAPDPRESSLLGISLHDCGWPLHDDSPTLNRQGLPADVLESTVELATRVWRGSSAGAAGRDPYAGLLVSLHVLTLSAMIAQHLPPLPTPERRQELFLLNQFQQDEIERQEKLRKQLGLRTDRPLTLGLADPGIDNEEDRLRFNFSWLRAMDALSLDACSGRRVFDKSPAVHPATGAPAIDLRLQHREKDLLAIDPWPFGVAKIELQVAAKRLPATPFADVEAFRRAYVEATQEMLTLRLVRG
jgi:hypothetical protein